MYTVLLVIHTLLALGIVGLVLIQRSDNDGFGLSGGGSNILSSRAKASFMTRSTAILASLFMVTSLALSMLSNAGQGDSLIDDLPTPAAASAPLDGMESPAMPSGAEQPADVPSEGGNAPMGEVPLAE
jgi:preprotein translocase subunit SecG